MVALLQRPGDALGNGLPLISGVTAGADGAFEAVVTIGNPLPNGDLSVAAACFEAEPPRPDNLILTYPLVAVTGQSPPIVGLEVDGLTLSFEDPCAGISSSMGVSPVTTLVGPADQRVPLEAVVGADGRATHELPRDLAAGDWTVIAECYRRRVSLPAIILAGTLVLAPDGPALLDGPGAPEAEPAAPLPGDASYTG